MQELVATDVAIDDALYALDRALQDEKIDHTVFLKVPALASQLSLSIFKFSQILLLPQNVRKLARDQFNARALAAKVLAKQQELAR